MYIKQYMKFSFVNCCNVFQFGSLNVNGEEFDIYFMVKNLGFRRRKRYVRCYGDLQKKCNNVMDRYKGL